MEAERGDNHQQNVLHQMLPTVLPVLLISVGYVDPGKWVATVEGGARFGFDLVAPMLLFSCAAILCQYLSARIAVVTGRNLAQICSDEYDRSTRVFLGVQAELSVVVLDLTMVLGVAHGINLLFGLDLSTGVFLAALDAVLFPIFATFLDHCRASFLCIYAAGFILLSYVFGVLNQPEISISMTGMATKLSGESAFALMSILGASIMPHNFYLHSSIVQEHMGPPNISKSALCHNHLLSILCVFGGIYLVNFVLMNSAANVFYSAGLVLVTFHDAMSLIEQVFRNGILPLVFLLVMFLSNQLTASTWNLGGQVVLHDFLGLDIPGWLHHATIRIVAMVPALYCVWTSGPEGVYQMFIFAQVTVALLLPSSVIPLFRVASSRPIMGVYKVSPIVEFLSLVTFMGMLGLKMIFIVEMIFGSSDWASNLRLNAGISLSVSFIVLLTAACVSFSLMLWLAATPLKSASSKSKAHALKWDLNRTASEMAIEREENESSKTRYHAEEPAHMLERSASAEKSIETRSNLSFPHYNLSLPEEIESSKTRYRGEEPAHMLERSAAPEKSIDTRSNLSFPHYNLSLPDENESSKTRYRGEEPAHMLDRSAAPEKSIETRSNLSFPHYNMSLPEENELSKTRYRGEEPAHMLDRSAAPEKSIETRSDLSFPHDNLDLPETIMESEQEIHLTTVNENSSNGVFTNPSTCNFEKPASITESASILVNEVADEILGTKTSMFESMKPIEKTMSVEGDMQIEKDDGDSREPEEPSKPPSGSISSLTPDGPPSFRSLSGKSDDGGNGMGSLSRLAGLGRAARRQLAAILDEFWGQLYDFHGQPTQEAKVKKLDVLLGVDSKPLKVDTAGILPSVGRRGSDTLNNSSLYDSPKQLKMQNGIDLSYGYLRGSSLWSNQTQLLDGYVQNSSHNVDSGERRYSSLRNVDSGERRYSSLRNVDSDERRYSSLRNVDSDKRRYSSLRNVDFDERRYSSLRNVVGSAEKSYSSLRNVVSGERRYSSLRAAPSADAWDYQPATVHGYQIASYLNRIGEDRSSDCLNDQMELPASEPPAMVPTDYRGSVAFPSRQKSQNGVAPAQPPGFENVVVSSSALQSEGTYNDMSLSGINDNSGISVDTRKYHSLPDISGLSVPHRMYEKSGQWDSSIGYGSPIGQTSHETSMYSTAGSNAGVPFSFDEPSHLKGYKDALPLPLSSGSATGYLWSRQPFEQFGVADKSSTAGNEALGSGLHSVTWDTAFGVDLESKLLRSFRHCIVRLLKLDGSDWLFRQNDGADEDLIDSVAARERFLYDAEARETNQVVNARDSQYLSISSVPHCGEGCIWKADLIISFGVWCIHRILDLSLMESRPELWGKYTYVLNRLQGVIDLAFSKSRTPMSPCFCVQIPQEYQERLNPAVSNGMLPPAAKPGKGKCTNAVTLMDIIKDVEIAISCRKGRTGTAAGDVAFPKGKENLASVLKRYKRRLSNKPTRTFEGSGPRNVPTSAPMLASYS